MRPPPPFYMRFIIIWELLFDITMFSHILTHPFKIFGVYIYKLNILLKGKTWIFFFLLYLYFSNWHCIAHIQRTYKEMNWFKLYTSTVNRQMELAGRTHYHIIYLINLHSFSRIGFCLLVNKFLNFNIFGCFIRCFGSSDLRFSLKLVLSNI